MRESLRRAAALAIVGAALCACNGNVRSANEVCTGIPGDPATPHAATNAPATHGPGIAGGAPLQLHATGGWPHKRLDVSQNITRFPMLYVYDDEAGFALGARQPPQHPALTDAELIQAGSFAFWSEVVNDRYYILPGVSSCAQTVLLGDDFNFRAPSGGLLFVQYSLPRCAACDQVSAAIQRTLDAHSEMPARWVQYDLASTTGKWCYSGYGFTPRERISRDEMERYTCPE